FTKVIIDYFMSKDHSISRKNKMFWHIARDDPMFNTITVIYRHQDTQIHSAIVHDVLTNQEMLDSKAYKEYYAVASGSEPPKAKTKYKKEADEPVTSSKSKTAYASKVSRLRSSAKVAKTTKKKQRAKMPKTKRLAVLSEVALSEAKKIKLATKRSKKDFHMSHASGSGDGVDIQSKVLDEQLHKSDEESWTFSQDEDDANEEINVNDDSEETESNNDGDDLTHPNLSTYKADDEEEDKEKADDDEVYSDHRMYTPPDHQLTDEKENQEGNDEVKEGEKEQEEEEELYGYLNINLQRSAAEMTDAQQENVQANQVIEDTHFINTSLDTGIDSILSPNIQSETLVNVPVFVGIVDNYLASKMKDTVDVAIQLQLNKLKEEAQAENQEFLNQNERGRQVIPWDYFNNNDLKYLKGGRSSRKYTTSITKTKAVNYGQVKWIKDKTQDYHSNQPQDHEVFGYSHLEEIIVRRQDDKLYKFREGDFKRLQRQGIKDVLLILIQDKLSNLNLEERWELKATRRRSTSQGQTHTVQFNDGTLNHVRTALNDISTGIEMDYLPKQKWSKQDKQRAYVMISAIDRKLRDRRLMRNLEKFVGGRPYGGDIRLLERTI
nr:hypothetical protein [Tanacetum cinerariifolium]